MVGKYTIHGWVCKWDCIFVSIRFDLCIPIFVKSNLLLAGWVFSGCKWGGFPWMGLFPFLNGLDGSKWLISGGDQLLTNWDDLPSRGSFISWTWFMCSLIFHFPAPFTRLFVSTLCRMFSMLPSPLSWPWGDPWWNSERDGQLDDDRRNHVDDGCIKPGGQWDTLW